MSDSSANARDLRHRNAPLAMQGETFRRLGYQAVDAMAELLDSLPQRPVSPGVEPAVMRARLGNDTLPRQGTDANMLLGETLALLGDNSLFNGHPRFMGYITSSGAPIGALADLIAAVINPNLGGWELSPMASEIEVQTIRWLAELIGYPIDCGGLLVSGGNVANFVGFLAGRRAKAPWDIRAAGLRNHPQLVVYGSQETHTWIQKAADLFGLGTDAMRWIPLDEKRRMRVDALQAQIRVDKKSGCFPFMVVAAAGTVTVGAVDPIHDIAAVCREHDLWLHVDGAYGAPAAVARGAPADLQALGEADSVAFDPHKWLYSSLEAGCTLVRRPEDMVNAFSFHPEYYKFDDNSEEPGINFYEFGLQNSRGFRALKVWLALRLVGREGYRQMIGDDIALARALFEAAQAHPELEAFTCNLSIATFRYAPAGLRRKGEMPDDYLNELNEALLTRLIRGGEAFVSNAVIDGKYALRACIVNFNTALDDVEALPEIVARIGRELDAEMRPDALQKLR
ncbi:MAG TPA: aminotransferase class V-fold PLP-dependent enzyme [Candidatus Binatia bacterium]|nr:aminotransferase class V-fold PLP-dependent enzyme [Candidatus Binatia bacterium]